MAKVPQINTSFHPDVTMPQPDYSALSSNPEELSSTASNLDTGRLAHFSGLSPMAPFTPASPFTSNMAAEHDHPGSPGQFSGGAQHAQSSGLSPPGSSPNAQFKVPQLKRRGSDASVASAHTHQPSLRPKASGLPQRAENGLMHIDIPRKFGEAGEYWKRYDDISERADKDMVEMLNANLDILLIFVSWLVNDTAGSRSTDSVSALVGPVLWSKHRLLGHFTGVAQPRQRGRDGQAPCHHSRRSNGRR